MEATAMKKSLIVLLVNFVVAAVLIGPVDAAAQPQTVLLSLSGEVLSLDGYPFPPVNPGDTAFVDGWEVVFSELLITVDHAWMASTPDLDPTDQSRTGPRVAQLDGPWVIDLHKGGPLPGAGGGGEQAMPFATMVNQNLVPGNPPFDPTVRYAFGYSVVRATPNAINVNLDPSQIPDYQFMIANGMTVLYQGTAVFHGTPQTCASTDPTFDFSTVPTLVNFKLGWKTPTNYTNCQNPSLPGPGVGGEDHPRGLIVSPSQQIIAQLTIHTDHSFWENFDSDGPPAHFDQFAVVARRQPDLSYLVQLEDTFLENYTAFPVPWRYCRTDLTGYIPPDTLPRMRFEQGRFYDPTLTQPLSSYTSFRDYYDFTSHVQSSQGHLNANGLCFNDRQFPSRGGQ
jgi:hypothetical protein